MIRLNGKRVRVGPRMQEAVYYVHTHPGCPKLHAARHVAPYGRALFYGYSTVNRAIKRGLIHAERVNPSRYRLWVLSLDVKVQLCI